MELLFHTVEHAFIDCLRMLPFLFAAFLLIEALEHYSGRLITKVMQKIGRAGPIVGAVVGCVPQCGFSVMAANLYAGGVISVGTLLAVFLATSDEAVLIILGNPGRAGEVGMLLGAKVLIAVIGGYAADLFLKERLSSEKSCGNLCDHCGCHEAHAGILMPAWRHTFRLFAYLFIFTWILNLVIEVFGIEGLSRALLGDSVFQPVIAALIGLIPNCGASVILTQLYLSGAISFASVVAGLCTGAGAGLIVLFKVNRNRIENIKIMIVLYFMAVVAGLLLQFVN
ncbi:MAG: putative manganese transporter [Merdimonas faecis]|uniref:putative manganese transporter n=1 Tax=Merdimonas faecis TaxID=1653435 RepID=UPI0022E56A85|nr:putative manganese transporter [Merdimonas faecis]